MSWKELLEWVNDPSRTHAELQEACRQLGVSETGNPGPLRRKLRDRIGKELDLDAKASWDPTSVSGRVVGAVRATVAAVTGGGASSASAGTTTGGTMAAQARTPDNRWTCTNCNQRNIPGHVNFCGNCGTRKGTTGTASPPPSGGAASAPQARPWTADTSGSASIEFMSPDNGQTIYVKDPDGAWLPADPDMEARIRQYVQAGGYTELNDRNQREGVMPANWTQRRPATRPPTADQLRGAHSGVPPTGPHAPPQEEEMPELVEIELDNGIKVHVPLQEAAAYWREKAQRASQTGGAPSQGVHSGQAAQPDARADSSAASGGTSSQPSGSTSTPTPPASPAIETWTCANKHQVPIDEPICGECGDYRLWECGNETCKQVNDTKRKFCGKCGQPKPGLVTGGGSANTAIVAKAPPKKEAEKHGEGNIIMRALNWLDEATGNKPSSGGHSSH